MRRSMPCHPRADLRRSAARAAGVLLGLAFLLLVTGAPVAHAASEGPPLTNQDVIDMIKAGLGPELVRTRIENGENVFDVTPQAMIALKEAGVSDDIILLMMKQKNRQQERIRSSINLQVQHLTSENPETRASAFMFLKQAGPVALPRIREYLGSQRAEIRAAAAEALGKLRDQASAPFLRELLTDRDQTVRFAAAEALGRLRDEDGLLVAQKAVVAGVPPLDGYLRLLGHARDRDYVRFVATRLLKEMDVATRENAAWALGEIGDAAGRPALEQALLEDRETGVKRAAAEALGKLRDPESVAALKRACRAFPQVRKATLEAIGAFPPRHSVEFLVAALGQKLTPEETQAVLVALRRLTSKDYGRDTARWMAWMEKNYETVYGEPRPGPASGMTEPGMSIPGPLSREPMPGDTPATPATRDEGPREDGPDLGLPTRPRRRPRGPVTPTPREGELGPPLPPPGLGGDTEPPAIEGGARVSQPSSPPVFDPPLPEDPRRRPADSPATSAPDAVEGGDPLDAPAEDPAATPLDVPGYTPEDEQPVGDTPAPDLEGRVPAIEPPSFDRGAADVAFATPLFEPKANTETPDAPAAER